MKRPWVQPLLMVPLWALFLWGWMRVWERGPRQQIWESLGMLAGFGAVYGVALILWVRYNQRLYRLKGARTQVRKVRYDFSRDALGRPIVRAADLSVEAHLVVEMREGAKVYRAAAAPEAQLAALDAAVAGAQPLTHARVDSSD